MTVRVPSWLNNAVGESAEDDRLNRQVMLQTDGNTPLSQRDGVRSPGTGDLLVTATNPASLQVIVAAGQAVIPPNLSALAQATYAWSNDAPVTLAVAAADPTNARRDLVIARVYDSQYTGTADVGTLEVLTGTPAVTPVDPPLPASGTYIVLARLTVSAGAASVTPGMIADMRSYTAALGGVLPVTSPADRPAGRSGLVVARLDTGDLEMWDTTGVAAGQWERVGGRKLGRGLAGSIVLAANTGGLYTSAEQIFGGPITIVTDGTRQFVVTVSCRPVVTVADGLVIARIRDGGASAPDASSPEILDVSCAPAQPNVATSFGSHVLWTPSAGTHQLRFFGIHLTGTGGAYFQASSASPLTVTVEDVSG